MKNSWVIIIFAGLLLSSCVTTQLHPVSSPQEFVLKIQGVDTVKVESDQQAKIQKSMQVPNQEGSLSRLSFICKEEAFIKLFSGLTVGDVSSLWNDVCILEKTTDIRRLNLFINSPGGDAFSGLALADQIERAKRKGFHVVAHASGIVASAAVPVFAVCNERFAAPGTIFMVHEASLWKWPGRETASDIRSQGKLMDTLRDRYLEKMVAYTHVPRDKWIQLEGETTWFDVAQAVEWGLVDRIE